jgi:hypothetical protein
VFLVLLLLLLYLKVQIKEETFGLVAVAAAGDTSIENLFILFDVPHDLSCC